MPIAAVALLAFLVLGGCSLSPTDSRAPRAVIVASPERGVAPFVATLDASRSTDDGVIVSYEWTFDSEPATAAGAVCTHAITTGGTHIVTLTVLDATGNSGATRVGIVADNAPPLANLRLSDGAPMVHAAMTADGSGSYDPEGQALTFRWDFGDGAVAEGPIAVHAYDAEGAYRVTLVVRDAAGAEATASCRALVQKPLPGGGCGGGQPVSL
jgi:PKD repeat protein